MTAPHGRNGPEANHDSVRIHQHRTEHRFLSERVGEQECALARRPFAQAAEHSRDNDRSIAGHTLGRESHRIDRRTRRHAFAVAQRRARQTIDNPSLQRPQIGDPRQSISARDRNVGNHRPVREHDCDCGHAVQRRQIREHIAVRADQAGQQSFDLSAALSLPNSDQRHAGEHDPVGARARPTGHGRLWRRLWPARFVRFGLSGRRSSRRSGCGLCLLLRLLLIIVRLVSADEIAGADAQGCHQGRQYQ